MASLQTLKKKLRGIKSTEKLTKAMKSVSAAKYSLLCRRYSNFEAYRNNCYSLYFSYAQDITSFLPEINESAPMGVFVFSSNKGMCGGFNTEIFSFFNGEIKNMPEGTLYFPCGKKAVSYFTEKNIPFSRSFIFSDVPSATEGAEFLDEIMKMLADGIISSVNVIYPEYKNVMVQYPVRRRLFKGIECEKSEDLSESALFVPDRKTVTEHIAERIISAEIYSVILETALGAQAATLTTMRSAYDTAVSYSAMLEIQINRIRQSEVTADVIETSQSE